MIKASGLAAGKGVVLPSSKEEAQAALKDIMLNKEFGSAGDEVVIEEFLTGQELSFLSFVDSYTMKSLVPAQDHKQIFDNGTCSSKTIGKIYLVCSTRVRPGSKYRRYSFSLRILFSNFPTR